MRTQKTIRLLGGAIIPAGASVRFAPSDVRGCWVFWAGRERYVRITSAFDAPHPLRVARWLRAGERRAVSGAVLKNGETRCAEGSPSWEEVLPEAREIYRRLMRSGLDRWEKCASLK